MLKVGVLGHTGRMGTLLVQQLQQDSRSVFSGGLGRRDHGNSGLEKISSEHHTLFKNSDVLVDFTTVGATQMHVQLARTHKKPLVIGTTGLSVLDQDMVTLCSEEIAVFQASNFSLAHNIMGEALEFLAKHLEATYDVEIFECHHAHKKDAPSGSALTLGRVVAQARGVSLQEPISLERPSKRVPGSIGFSVSRGGNVTGDHTVTFLGQEDLLSISHRAFSPVLFAQGALKAAHWVVSQPPGLYGMSDLIKSFS